MEKSSSSSTSKPSSVIPYSTKNLKDLYKVGTELGIGQSGTTYLCTEISTGTQYACKSIFKRTLLSQKDYENVWNEIKIMHHLSDHPNVVRIRGTYEDSDSVHLVMELCSGGELFHRVEKKGRYPERKAAQIIKTIVEVVENCHSLGVIHRDLKLENFLFSSIDEDAALKAIDFGSSVFYKPGDTFSDAVGSPYYIAPEVLQKHYGPESDVWSAGVILYVLLSGVRPFQEEGKDLEIRILEEKIDFESKPWTKISENAKDLTRKMLERNPKERLTAHEVLCHPWIVDDGVPPDKPLEYAVLSRLKHFSTMNKFKKIVLRLIAIILKEEEIAGLKELFKMIDTDNSKTITSDELKDGLRKVGSELNDPEIKILMDGADINNSGTIECDEFLAATLHLNKVESEENLKSAFSVFDIYNNGYTNIYDIRQICRLFCQSDVYLDEMFREIDPNYVVCTFSFEQFVRLILKCYDEHDIPTKKDEIHHLSQSIRYQRHVQNSGSACGDDVCDIREWLPKSKMDLKLWRLVVLLIGSYLTLGQAYKDDDQLNQALKAVDLACGIYGSIPQHLDDAVFDKSSLSRIFWAKAWLLVGDVYNYEHHRQQKNMKCHDINCRCKSDSRQSSPIGTSSSSSSSSNNVPPLRTYGRKKKLATGLKRNDKIFKFLEVDPVVGDSKYNLSVAKSISSGDNVPPLTTDGRKKNLATGLTEYDKIFKFLEVGPVVGDSEYNLSVAESCYDAKKKALFRFSTGSTELRQQEAEYSYFQHGCYHRDYCLKFLEKVKQNASLAETNWQKSKEFYGPKTHPVMYLTILMEESSLLEKLSDSFHLNEMLESALSRLLEGRHVLGGTTEDFSEMNRKFLKQLRDLLNRMCRVALSGNTSKSSVIVPHSIPTNTNRSGDVGKLKKLYEMSLRSIDLSQLNAMYELWSS